MIGLSSLPDDQFWGVMMMIAVFGPWMVPVVARGLAHLIVAWAASRRGGAA